MFFDGAYWIRLFLKSYAFYLFLCSLGFEKHVDLVVSKTRNVASRCIRPFEKYVDLIAPKIKLFRGLILQGFEKHVNLVASKTAI